MVQLTTNRGSRAGGVIIALAVVGGAVLGIRFGQPSLGTIAGATAGTLFAIALYLYDRRRLKE